ncbi:MAG: hypothetical protein KDB53_09225, partial [Planctomycetes bacterium]|nr:hypothetical protein [Planctomycetota bacterium]
MRHLTLLALLAFTLGTTAAPTVAGQGKPQTEPDASTTSQVTIKLSESEIADFEKLFSEWMKKNDIETRHALSTAVSEYAKSHAKGPKPESDGEVDDSGSPLKDIEAWQGIFKRHFVDELKRKPGGRVAEEELEIRPRGQLYLFEYAYRLPKGYDEHESWP